MRLLPLLSLLLLFSSCVQKEKEINVEHEFQLIDSVLYNQQNAWSRGDLAGFMNGYWENDSLRFISSRGETFGYQKVLSNYQQGYPNKEKMGKLTFVIKNRAMLSERIDIAQVTGVYSLKRNKFDDNQKDTGWFSLLFKKFPSKGWKIVIDHTF